MSNKRAKNTYEKMQNIGQLSEALHVLNKEAKRLRDVSGQVWDYIHYEGYVSLASPDPECRISPNPTRNFLKWAERQDLRDCIDPTAKSEVRQVVLHALENWVYGVYGEMAFEEIFEYADDMDFLESFVEMDVSNDSLLKETVEELYSALGTLEFAAEQEEDRRQDAWEEHYDKLQKSIEELCALKDAALAKLKRHFVCYHLFKNSPYVFEYYEIGNYSFHRPTELDESEVEGEVKELEIDRIPYYKPDIALNVPEAKDLVEKFVCS